MVYYTPRAPRNSAALSVFSVYTTGLHDRSLHDLKYIKFQIIRFRDVPEYRVVG